TKGARGNEIGAPSSQDVPSIVKLAGQLYNQRILELKALIRKDEECFRSLVAELDEIRQGKWDNQLEEELRKSPPQATNHVVGAETTKTDPLVDSVTAPATTDQQQPPAQPESESASSTESSIAPSTLDSTSTLTPAEKPDPIIMKITEESPAESDLPVQVKPKATESLSDSLVDKEKDVEMEDVSETEPSLAQSQALPSFDNMDSQDHHADVEMEDTSKDLSLSVPENSTPMASTDSTLDHGTLVNTEAIEVSRVKDDAEPSSTVSETQPEPQDFDTSAPEDNVEMPEEDAEVLQKEAVKDMKAEDESTLEAAKSPQPLESEPQSGEDASQDLQEGVELKTEDADMEVGTEADTTQDHVEEGATSADDDETASTKSGRKPKKIKTAIPAKRKRRHGRSGGGDHEDGYQSSDSETTDSANTNVSDQLARTQMDDKKWKKILMMIWSDIANHRFGAVFMQPIKEQDAPGYYYMIKRPMDLKSIKERIRDGQITNADEFHRDVLLMFMNAIMYNNEDTEIHQMALAMMAEVEFIIKNFKSSQSFAPPSNAASNTGGSGAVSGGVTSSATPVTRTSEAPSSTGSARRRQSSGVDE
ncbi:Bromodomain-containing protein 8, partial [Lunasporangiospora selenospora]